MGLGDSRAQRDGLSRRADLLDGIKRRPEEKSAHRRSTFTEKIDRLLPIALLGAITLINAGLLVALLAAAIPLVAAARRIDVSYPIVLVLGGLILGFVPGLPAVQLDPSLVLLVFLPPLLYWEAITAPSDVMLENAGQIGLLAIGLVIATTAAVAVVAHAIVPEMPWAAALVLGAIVSPTDELAAVAVLRHFRLPRQVTAIVEGESLLNDATALVIYASAIAAVSSGALHLGNMFAGFVANAVGSVIIGLLAGRIVVELWRRIKDRELQGAIALIAPFLAYLPAQYAGLSGVVAVVTGGVYVNHFTPRVMVPAARTQIIAFYEMLAFISNTLLFLVVGLQLNRVARAAFAHDSWLPVLGYVVAVNLTIIAVRLILVVLAEYAPVSAPASHAAPNWRNALVVAWSGLRGSISLAAALAIPVALPSGGQFPHRDLIIFLTFSVILVTLVGGGLTLPSVVRNLHIEGGGDEEREMQRALVASSEAALARIAELEREGRLDAPHADTMRRRFEHRRDLQLQSDEPASIEHAARHGDIELEVIAAQRKAIIEMRERGEIDNVVLRRLQSNLDLASLRPEFGAESSG